MNVTKPLYFDNSTSFPSMSCTLNSKMVFASFGPGLAAILVLNCLPKGRGKVCE